MNPASRDLEDRIAELIPRVRGLARWLCRRHDISAARNLDDMVGAGLLRVARELPRYDGSVEFDKAVLRWAGCGMRSHIGREVRRNRIQSGPLVSEVAAQAPEEAVAEPEEVRAAVDALPERERAVVLRVFWGGSSVESIRRSVGSKWATVKRRYDAGLGRLRRMFAEAA